MENRRKTKTLSHTEYLHVVLEWKGWEKRHKRLVSAIRYILMENESLKKKLDEMERR